MVVKMCKEGLYRFLRPILTILIKIIFHPKVIGKENIPKEGRAVLAGNHTNILDPVFILSLTKRTVHFLAKIELINSPLGIGYKHMGIVPVNRQIKDKTVMPAAIDCLNNNLLIGVFPEGTVNKTKEPTIKFKTGAVRMANETNSNIVPFAITGKYTPFGKLTISFGKPYKVSDDVTRENEKLRSIINEMIIERR